jgi:hypothetical protein
LENNLQLLRSEIETTKNQRYKLMFLFGSIKKSNQLLINEFQKNGYHTINVSLFLSDKLRQISSEKRPYEVVKWLKQAINEQKSDVVFLHNIEYLFDPELKQNPVKLLEALSGNTVLLVLWPGKEEHGVLNYATPEHPEYYQNDEYSNCIFTY